MHTVLFVKLHLNVGCCLVSKHVFLLHFFYLHHSKDEKYIKLQAFYGLSPTLLPSKVFQSFHLRSSLPLSCKVAISRDLLVPRWVVRRADEDCRGATSSEGML